MNQARQSLLLRLPANVRDTGREKYIPSRSRVHVQAQVPDRCGVSYAPKASSDQKRPSCAQTESIEGSMYEAKKVK